MSRKTNVAICGGAERDAWLHARAYRDCESAALTGFWTPDPSAARARAESFNCSAFDSVDAVISDSKIDTVVLLDTDEKRTDLAVKALNTGKNVLLGPPFGLNLDEAKKLLDTANKSKGKLMSAEPHVFHQPFQKVLGLTKKKTVGLATAVRLRSLLAGEGGWDTYLNPDFKQKEDTAPPNRRAVIFREAFEKMSLAHRLYGYIDEVFGIIPENAPEESTAVITWKHRAHATYGVMDLTFAPKMRIRSAFDPRDDALEVTGSCGIIWLTLGSSQMRKEPTVRVYRGENLHEYGNLKDDWQNAYDDCAGYFADCVTTGKTPEVYPYESMHVTECVQAAFESAASGKRVKINSGFTAT